MCGRNRSVCDVSDPRFLCHVHKFINSALITVWHYQTAFQETVRSFLIVCLQLWILNMMILVQTWDIHSLWVIFAVLDSILLWQNFSHSHGGRQLSAVKIECRAQQVSWNVSGLRGLNKCRRVRPKKNNKIQMQFYTFLPCIAYISLKC